jgi:hypothetical protein
MEESNGMQREHTVKYNVKLNVDSNIHMRNTE